jgi:hypothetical protein
MGPVTGRPGESPRFPRLLLLAGGALLLLAGATAVAAGIAIPDRLLALLPPVAIDSAAVGGATVALGLLIAALGLLELLLGLVVRGRSAWRVAAAVVVIGLIGILLVALGVALLTEVAAGASVWLVPAGLALVATGVVHWSGGWVLASTGAAAQGRLPE